MSTLPEDWLDELQTQLQQRGVLLYPWLSRDGVPPAEGRPGPPAPTGTDHTTEGTA